MVPHRTVGPEDKFSVQERGLQALRVHPVTGQVQGHAVASGWMLLSASHAVLWLIRTARRGDVLVFFTVVGGDGCPKWRSPREMCSDVFNA